MDGCLTRAAEHGADDGSAAATWQDSFEDVEHALRCLRLDEDGDPAWDDAWHAGDPLDGGWGDGWTPRELALAVGAVTADPADDDDDEIDAVCDAYEDAYREAFREHVIRAARDYLASEADELRVTLRTLEQYAAG